MKLFQMAHMYCFWSAILADILAQVLKPLLYYLWKKEWKWELIKASGGFPSSHSATVSALALSVGLQEHFSSTIFAVTLVFACIIIYDAANVRYYSGQNIQITQQLIKDVKEQMHIPLIDPIYSAKIKTVLGHNWIEVAGGILVGILVALLLYVL